MRPKQMNKIKTIEPTMKDIFAQRITKEIFNYRKDFGVLTFIVRFNSGKAASLSIIEEERISVDFLHKQRNKES